MTIDYLSVIKPFMEKSKHPGARFCDALYEGLTGKYGFETVGDYFGYENGMIYIDYKTHRIETGNGLNNGTADPEDLDGLERDCNVIAFRFGYHLYCLETTKNGCGHLWFAENE